MIIHEKKIMKQIQNLANAIHFGLVQAKAYQWKLTTGNFPFLQQICIFHQCKYTENNKQEQY